MSPYLQAYIESLLPLHIWAIIAAGGWIATRLIARDVLEWIEEVISDYQEWKIINR